MTDIFFFLNTQIFVSFGEWDKYQSTLNWVAQNSLILVQDSVNYIQFRIWSIYIYSALDLDASSMDEDGPVLCEEYMHVRESPEEGFTETHFNELVGMYFP